jgi:SAM-dependent methyltransferase
MQWMTELTETEHFRPIPLRFNASLPSRIAFGLRCFVDLQLGTIWKFLSPRLAGLHGDLLDVGCGEMPYRSFLPRSVRYTGIDVPQASAFSMHGNEEVVPFDGFSIPFPDASFDTLLCTEVLEHSPEPAALIKEMERVLKPGGILIATVPFSARVHYAPYDFHRFSKYALDIMFRSFTDVHIQERGNDIAVIANKLIIVALRIVKPSPFWLVQLPLLLPLLPLALIFLLLAHLTMALGLGSKDDSLGYGLVATRR